MRILEIILKMYKVTCECGRYEVISIYEEHGFSFDAINELYANFTCTKCNHRGFKIKFMFEQDQFIAINNNTK